MKKQITTWFLEMLSPDCLRSSQKSCSDFNVVQVKIPYPDFNRFLYEQVGKNWYWIDKLSWSAEQWGKYVNRPELETWVGYLHGAPAGYFELEKQPQDQVELIYFGLLPQYFGRGLGGILLTRAIERAWLMGAHRVWVRTCNHDHPVALQNYLARGFVLYKETCKEIEIP